MRQRTKLRNKVAQETDAGRPIQVFDLGPWPLTWEAAVILANEAARERAALYEETMTRIHAEMMEGLR